MVVTDPPRQTPHKGWARVAAPARPAYDWGMTTTPIEPESDPQVVPSGDPGTNPVAPGQEPDAPVPEADPDRDK